MTHEQIDIFWNCFPMPPSQPAVGDNALVYLDMLNRICGLKLTWPIRHPTGPLTRLQLRDLCRDKEVDVLIAYAAVMAWGGRGVHSPNYRLSLTGQSLKTLVDVLKYLRASKQNRETDFAAMQKAAKEINGLGISFYTKLLFFLRENPDAYILDQFTAKSAQQLLANCQIILTNAGYPDPDTSPESYEWFCSSLEDFAKNSQTAHLWTGELVEQAMFDVRGGLWRKHLRSVYGKSGSTQAKVTTPTGARKSPPKPAKNASIAGDSLPARVAGAHAYAYGSGNELPGSNPQVGTARPVRVHCSLIDGVIWQYAFTQTSIHAEVFIPARHVTRYNALRSFLAVNGHEFGDGITGNGEKNGKTRAIKITLNRGLNAPTNEWNNIACEAVSAMAILFDRVCETL